MAANVESMFYVREKPWHGLGVEVAEALDSEMALEKAGLNKKGGTIDESCCKNEKFDKK